MKIYSYIVFLLAIVIQIPLDKHLRGVYGLDLLELILISITLPLSGLLLLVYFFLKSVNLVGFDMLVTGVICLVSHFFNIRVFFPFIKSKMKK